MAADWTFPSCSVTQAPRVSAVPDPASCSPAFLYSRPQPSATRFYEERALCIPALPSITRCHGAPTPWALISLPRDRNKSTNPCGDSPPWAVQVRGCSTPGFVSILQLVFLLLFVFLKLRHHVTRKLPCHPSHELPPPSLSPQHPRILFPSLDAPALGISCCGVPTLCGLLRLGPSTL